MTIDAFGSHMWSVTKEIKTSFYNKGVANTLNDWGTSGDGIERVTRVAASIITLMAANSILFVKSAERVLHDTRELLYALIFFRSVAQLTSAPGYPKITRANITSTLLLAVGGACELVQFSYKAQLIQTTLFSKWSGQLGQYRVFNYSPFDHLTSRPSQFFLFLSLMASSLENVYSHYTKKDSLANTLKARDLLLHIGNGGRMCVIAFHHSHYSQILLQVIDIAAQVADLTYYSMRQRFKKI